MKWDKNCKVLVSGSEDRSFARWHIKEPIDKKSENELTLKPEYCIYGHQTRIWDLIIHEEENMIITCGEDCKCKFWDLTTGTYLGSINVMNRLI